jgi:hypothetical protein
MTYDDERPLDRVPRGDVTTTLSEDRALRKVMEQDSTGNRRTILYDQGNRITSITDPSERRELGVRCARQHRRGAGQGGHTTRYT